MTVLAKSSNNLTTRPTDSAASRELTAEVGGWQLEVSPAREIAAKESTTCRQRLE
jgi:hypothetical protein